MKTDIHPSYVIATVRCSCGNSFTTPLQPKTISTSSCATSATPSTPASKSSWTRVAASSASSVATASGARLSADCMGRRHHLDGLTCK